MPAKPSAPAAPVPIKLLRVMKESMVSPRNVNVAAIGVYCGNRTHQGQQNPAAYATNTDPTSVAKCRRLAVAMLSTILILAT
jgi:hypothetical protein